MKKADGADNAKKNKCSAVQKKATAIAKNKYRKSMKNEYNTEILILS